jgi:hypothetical protein
MERDAVLVVCRSMLMEEGNRLGFLFDLVFISRAEADGVLQC